MIRTQTPSICFVAPKLYGLLAGRADLETGGGAEVQQYLLATELARRGWRVSAVTLDHGQADGIELDGVRVFKAYAADAGLPGLRFVYPRWMGLCAALHRADADVYYQRGAGSETGQTAIWCRRNGRRFIFAVASDKNCIRALPGLTLKERPLFRHGLTLADAVVAQTGDQSRRLHDGYRIKSAILLSCAADPHDGAEPLPWRDLPDVRRLLWVGRFAPVKRAEMFLDLAEQCPDYLCDIVGGGRNDRYSDALIRRAGRMPNVILHGRVDYDCIGRFYSQAALLVCTSRYEGFPNTFLEAWARGVPTLSTVDPDGVIATNGLGAVGHTVDQLAAHVRRIGGHSGDWNEYSRRARSYFIDRHSTRAAVDGFERILLELADSGARTASSPPGPSTRTSSPAQAPRLTRNQIRPLEEEPSETPARANRGEP